MTAALEGGEWSAARPGCTIPLGKTRYPFYRRLGGPQGRSERAENLVPTRMRSRTFQSVVSRYTDWATRPILYRFRIQIFLYCFTFIGPCVANVFAEYNQQDAAFLNLFISVRRPTCFRRVFRPSSGAQNCTYSARHLSDRYCYLLPAWPG